MERASPNFISAEAIALFQRFYKLNLTLWLPPFISDSNVDEFLLTINLTTIRHLLGEAASQALVTGKLPLAKRFHVFKKLASALEAEDYVSAFLRPSLTEAALATRRLYDGRALESDAVTLVDNLLNFEKFENQWKNLMENATQRYVNHVVMQADWVVSSLLVALETNVGTCDCLWTMISSFTDLVCVNLLLPFNGFWFSLGVYLLLAPGALFAAIKLASLDRKLHPYSPSLNIGVGLHSDQTQGHRLLNRAKDFYGYSPGQPEHVPLTLNQTGKLVRKPPGTRHRAPVDAAPIRCSSDFCKFLPYLGNNLSVTVPGSPNVDGSSPPCYPDYPPPSDIDLYRPCVWREKNGLRGEDRYAPPGLQPPPSYCLPDGGFDSKPESIHGGWIMDSQWTIDSP